MKDWKDILQELAKKLTTPLAFAAFIVIVVALLGRFIPPVFETLIYIVVTGGMGIYAILAVLGELANRKKDEHEKPILLAPQPVPQSLPSPREEHPLISSPLEKESGGDRDKAPIPADPQAARQAYLEALIQDCSPVRLVGLDPNAADPVRGGLSLEKVYVSLDTTTTVKVEEEEGKKKNKREEELARLQDREKTRPLSALEALVQTPEHTIVLLGLPGTGKSTFVRFLALRMAQTLYREGQNLAELLPGWQGKPLLPIIVPLGRMAESFPAETHKGEAALVEKFIQQMLADDPRMVGYAPHILAALKTEGGLVLFDGLDEVADLRLRPVLIEAIRAFTARYTHPASCFAVTCRTYSYYHDKAWQLTGWRTFELALLDPDKIRQFVTAWYDEFTHLEPARSVVFSKKKDNLLNALHPEDRRRLSEIAPFPIILTMMAVVNTHYGELPDTRAQVYERCTDLLLVRWELEREVLPGKTQKQNLFDALGVQPGLVNDALHEIAFKAHKGLAESGGGETAALVTEDLLSGVMQVFLKDPQKVKTFLDYCQSANGLLMLQGTLREAGGPPDAPARRIYTFPHRTFQEYLAGRYLIRPQIGKRVRELIDSSDQWREVVLLLGEYLCFQQGDNERVDAIFQTLAPNPLPERLQANDWRALWLAGDLLVLYNRRFKDVSPHAGRIVSGLRRLVEAGALALRERAAAADTLDELGWLPPDLHQFIHIEAPTKDVPMRTVGTPPSDGGRMKDEIHPFSIAKYPITNIQYQRFLESLDFAEEKFWTAFPKFDEHSQPMKDHWGEEGWKWLQSHWDEDKKVYPRNWRDPRFGIARKGVPVVGITWYEANAYCRWLQEHWDEQPEGMQNTGLKPALVRLPTETEWVAAAGGDDPRERFPWDESGKITKEQEDILRRANVDESGINRTTPVGMYPLGASPTTGVWDMAGNAWEWQANFHSKDYKYPALRGGSFGNELNLARLSARSLGLPFVLWSVGGFRVVVLPS